MITPNSYELSGDFSSISGSVCSLGLIDLSDQYTKFQLSEDTEVRHEMKAPCGYNITEGAGKNDFLPSDGINGCLLNLATMSS